MRAPSTLAWHNSNPDCPVSSKSLPEAEFAVRYNTGPFKKC